MSNEASQLRELAQALDDLEAMETYKANLPDGGTFGVRLDWAWGSSCTGYEQVKRAVSAQVEASVRGFIHNAVVEQELKIGRIREEYQL